MVCLTFTRFSVTLITAQKTGIFLNYKSNVKHTNYKGEQSGQQNIFTNLLLFSVHIVVILCILCLICSIHFDNKPLILVLAQ